MAQTIETMAMVSTIALERSERQVKARKTLRKLYAVRVWIPSLDMAWMCRTRAEFNARFNKAIRISNAVVIDNFYS